MLKILGLVVLVASTFALADEMEPRVGLALEASPVHLLFSFDRGTKTRCSSFFISHHLVVTAAHCVAGENPQIVIGKGTKATLVARGVNFNFKSDVDKNATDWAIVRSSLISYQFFKLASTAIRPVDLGFLVSANLEVRAFPVIFLKPSDHDTYLISTYVRQGDSGGPILNAQNEAVGIMSVLFSRDRGRGADIVKIEKIINEIKRLNLRLD